MQTHTIETFAFSELSPNAQEGAIERYRQALAEWSDYSDWIDAVDVDYWREERLAPFGVHVNDDPKDKRFSYAVQAQENPDSLEFSAWIDLPVYMRAHKLGNKYRAAYYAATSGDIYSVEYDGTDVAIEYDGDHYPRHFYRDGSWIVEASPRAKRIAAQLECLEEHIADFCNTLAGEWCRAFIANINWRYSDEYIRETLADDELSPEFLACGRIYRF